ncbi:hypothetical protein [Flavobacterium sp. H122]|uniref:hypothetical protein n=1 Tax=Flavobacterium sp. H122 TaxID=2529860 RepID=UPI0010AAE3E1|nr:hypothetical protein [Flavobacterium sp. H122]
MNPIIKNILAVIAGLFIGSIVNMGIILMGGFVISLPEGIDPSNMESLKAGMHLFEPKHFVFPFLAHAFGTLTGSFTASRFGASYKFGLAMFVGCFFLLGGISNVFALPAPMWFSALDLSLGYIPMAYLGWKLGVKKKLE